jgi:hypothetical protein
VPGFAHKRWSGEGDGTRWFGEHDDEAVGHQTGDESLGLSSRPADH